jgi:uncharacterized protein YdgA (DUF945 family)
MPEVEQCRSTNAAATAASLTAVAPSRMIRDAEAPRRRTDARDYTYAARFPMNKVAIVAAALLAIVLLALPGVVGSITEARVRERVAAIDASPNADAELKSFDRGWLRSTARIELQLVPDTVAQLADAAGTPLGVFGTLPIVVELAHGPVALQNGVHFGWSTMVARPDMEAPGVAELTQTLGVPYIFEFRGSTPYLGGLRFDADAPPFQLPIDEALLTFSGGTLAGSLDGRQLDADAQLGSLELTSPTGTFAVRGLSARADNELRSQYVMPGETSLTIASISMAYPPQNAAPMFEVSNLKMQSDVDIDATGELLEMRVTYDVDTMRVEDNEVTAGSLGATVRNLDVAAVEAYSAAAADAAAGADAATLAASFGPLLERALKAGPSLTLDPIRFRYDGEPFDGRIEITTRPEQLPSAGTLSLDNPLMMLGLFNAKADLRVSKTLAGQLATLGARMQLAGDPTIPPDQLEYMAEAQSGLMITLLLGQGVLIEDGEAYRTSVESTGGSLTLNGNPLPFGLQ